MVLELVLLSTMTCQVTSYRSIPEQTDDSPYYTSIGEHVNPSGVAVSRDFLKTGTLHYGDWVYIEGFGLKRVNDCMAKRHHRAFDIWVETKEQEHHIGVRHLRVYKVRLPPKVLPGLRG